MILRNIFKYYINNKSRFITVFMAIALGVFLVYFIDSIIFSMSRTLYDSDVEPRRQYSIVRQKDLLPDESLIKSIQSQAAVERTLPLVYWSTSMQMTIGGLISTDILMLKEQDMDYMMDKLGLHVSEGRKPTPGNHEILLHSTVAANKGLKVGDYFGSVMSKNEWMNGAYQIVGLVDGKGIASFAPYETFYKDSGMTYEYMYGALVIPKEGKLGEMNAYLNTLPYTYSVVTQAVSEKTYKGYTANINLFGNFVCLSVILIVALCIGFLCYIYSYQRRSEQGLLLSLGYSRQQIIIQAFLEILGMNLFGLLFGALISIGALSLLSNMVYVPKGQFLQVLSLRSLIRSFSICIFSILFSVLPIWRMLKKLDPISIIEGGM